MRREIQDLKAEQSRLLEQRQKDFIDQEILESRIMPVKILCDEKERSLIALEEQRRRKDDAAAAEARIVEFCEQVAEGLEDASPDGKRATFAAFQTKVQATRNSISVFDGNPDSPQVVVLLRNSDGNPDSPQVVVFLATIVDVPVAS